MGFENYRVGERNSESSLLNSVRGFLIPLQFFIEGFLVFVLQYGINR